jgi:two-component system alkaline phosphatase synthesis response regulator PhoP
MTLILVVEDELSIARIVRDYLAHEGFEVEHAADGEAALIVARNIKPDLIVLDLRLPKRDGLDVAREVRKTSNVPILMLTARGEEADRVAGLELGADDYMVKPFSPRELVARIRAVLRRSAGTTPGAAEVYETGGLKVDVQMMRAQLDGRVLDLTPTEFQLLTAFARQPGRVFTRAQLLDALHGVAFESYERAIDAHIKNMRKKLEVSPAQPRYILTVHGVGYRLNDAT